MSRPFGPAPQVAALASSRPFVGPEELMARTGLTSLVRLGANESAFGPPPRALEAMRAALEDVSFYGDPESFALRAALAAKHGCALENITVGSGIDDLLGLAVRAFLGPGDASVSTLGTYATYAYHVTGYGGRLETVSYAAGGTADLDALARRAFETEARIVYLANPDSPSGTFLARAAVEEFAASLPPASLFVLDEAYGDFIAPSDLVAETIHPRLVRMRTFSKAYGLAGARIAYCIAAPETIATLGKIRVQYGVNRTAQAGALAALREQPFVANVVAEVARGRTDYEAIAARLRLATIPSRTNFVCFDLGSRARAEAMVDAMLARGIFIRKPGAPPLDGHIRVTVGTAADRQRFGAALAVALAELPHEAVR